MLPPICVSGKEYQPWVEMKGSTVLLPFQKLLVVRNFNGGPNGDGHDSWFIPAKWPGSQADGPSAC